MKLLEFEWDIFEADAGTLRSILEKAYHTAVVIANTHLYCDDDKNDGAWLAASTIRDVIEDEVANILPNGDMRRVAFLRCEVEKADVERVRSALREVVRECEGILGTYKDPPGSGTGRQDGWAMAADRALGAVARGLSVEKADLSRSREIEIAQGAFLRRSLKSVIAEAYQWRRCGMYEHLGEKYIQGLKDIEDFVMNKTFQMIA